MKTSDIISASGSLENALENMEMKAFAKEVLLEENYEKFIKSYRFMFWFQLIGCLAGFIIPSVVLVMITQEVSYLAFGAFIGILWACVWLMISLFVPQGKICRKFTKWFRKRGGSLKELDEIFYEE
jgi:hypothetical protein